MAKNPDPKSRDFADATVRRRLPIALDQESSLPTYVQIGKQVEALIHAGRLKEGDPLPSEPRIADELGVSKMTVRQAIGELVSKGLLRRQRGRGTFVCRPKVSIRLPYFMSYTQDMRRRGYVPRTEHTSIEEVPASGRQAEQLDVEAHEALIRIVRMRFADELPMALETTWLVKRLVPHFADQHTGFPSRYALLENEYNIRPTRAEQTLEAVSVTVAESRHLGVPPGAPAILIEGIVFDQDDRPFEISKSVYRADRYQVSFERTRSEFE